MFVISYAQQSHYNVKIMASNWSLISITFIGRRAKTGAVANELNQLKIDMDDGERWDLLYICLRCSQEYTTKNERNESQMRPCNQCGFQNPPTDSVNKWISIIIHFTHKKNSMNFINCSFIDSYRSWSNSSK